MDGAATLIEGLPHASQANGQRGASAVKTSSLVRLNVARTVDGAHRVVKGRQSRD
jgi:hypothetical protein